MLNPRLIALANRWNFAVLNGRLFWGRLLGRSAYPRYQDCRTAAEELAVHRRWLAEVYLSLRRLASDPANGDLPALTELRDAYAEALDLTDSLIGAHEHLRGLQFALRQAAGERAESLGYEVVGGMVLLRRLWQERQAHLQRADEIVRRWMNEVPFSRLSTLEFAVHSPLPRREPSR